MDTVNTTLFNTVRTLFLTEARRITGQCIRQLVLVLDRIDEFTDHGMLGSSDQVKILALDLVHHGIHFIKAHNAGHHIAADHKWRNAVSKATVDHKVSRIGKDRGMQSRNVSHQIVESVSGYFSGSVKIDAVEALHDLRMIRNFKIRYDRLTEFLDLNVAAVVFSDWNARVNDIRDDHHIFGDLFLQFFFFCFKLRKTCRIRVYLGFDCFRFAFFALSHQCADLFGKLVSARAQIICFLLCSSRFFVKGDHFVHQR